MIWIEIILGVLLSICIVWGIYEYREYKKEKEPNSTSIQYDDL